MQILIKNIIVIKLNIEIKLMIVTIYILQGKIMSIVTMQGFMRYLLKANLNSIEQEKY